VTAAFGCGRGHEGAAWRVVARVPHDTAAYTQGLVYASGALYESTGLYGLSEVRRADRATGRVDAARRLAPDRFGEGLTLLDGRLYQLTWQSMVGYVYDAATLAPLDSFRYDGEGWGLTTDGTVLIMSDGTAQLRFLDPSTFTVVREVTVRDHGSPLSALNELEYVDGVLFANVYQSDWIVRVDPDSGTVLEWIDFKGLLPDRDRTPQTDVLNGIAYDPDTGNLLLTGKRWPWLFEVQLRPSRYSRGLPSTNGSSTIPPRVDSTRTFPRTPGVP
jgi:glutaminyl-peptide cyclotransferase